MKTLSEHAPVGVIHEVGGLTVLRDGQQSCYRSALLISFDDVVLLQEALELGHCFYRFEYEQATAQGIRASQ